MDQNENKDNNEEDEEETDDKSKIVKKETTNDDESDGERTAGTHAENNSKQVCSFIAIFDGSEINSK